VIRAVIDANTLVSIFPADDGSLAKLYAHWNLNHFRIVTSEHILLETERAWTKPYWEARFSPDHARSSMQLLRQFAEIIELTRQAFGMATHPEDDLLLATVLSSGADYLVTGDRQLQRLGKLGDALIVSPATFFALLSEIYPSTD